MNSIPEISIREGVDWFICFFVVSWAIDIALISLMLSDS